MTSDPASHVVVVAASAGGVEALSAFVGALPAELPAAVLVVLHLPSNAHSALPEILTRVGPLVARQAVDGEPLHDGVIYVAPPDRHLLIDGDGLSLKLTPRENGQRPAADPLFRSAATHYGSRACGVVLSGTLDDGAAGLVSVIRQGGHAFVQAPADALYPGMPQSALRNVPDAAQGTATELAEAVSAQLAVATPDGPRPPPPELGQPLEVALWMALRTLDEKSAFNRRLAGPARARNDVRGDIYDDAADEADSAAGAIRAHLLHRADPAVLPD